MEKRKRSQMEKDVDQEIIAKGLKATEDFDHSQTLTVHPKPRTSKLISIRLSLEMMKDLRAAAERKGLPGYQGLIKTFIQKGLDGERTGPLPLAESSDFLVAEGRSTKSRSGLYQTTTNQPSATYWSAEVSDRIPLKEASWGGKYK